MFIYLCVSLFADCIYLFISNNAAMYVDNHEIWQCCFCVVLCYAIFIHKQSVLVL